MDAVPPRGEYHWFCARQVEPDWQQVGPVHPWPPHCPHRAEQFCTERSTLIRLFRQATTPCGYREELTPEGGALVVAVGKVGVVVGFPPVFVVVGGVLESRPARMNCMACDP
jgi:hypothetical protein